MGGVFGSKNRGGGFEFEKGMGGVSIIELNIVIE